ncbi:MAG: flagellar protein FlgN [Firmicutes bacterium]|nr:flagellar protein FlgN [Bacillota bacterium]
MDQRINELISVMREQVKIIDLFRELGESKTPALVKGRYEELERIIKVEELLIVEMGHLERQRVEGSQEIAQLLQIPVEEISISRLQSEFAGCSEELESIKDQLLVGSRELGELNQLNNELIEQSLRHLDFTVQLLTETESGGGYSQRDRDAVISPQETARIFDRWA